MSNKNTPEPQSDDSDPPSKSQRKRDAKVVLALAARLLASRPSEIRKLDLPEPILATIAQGTSITRFGARKRHTQFLAKMLRNDADVETIEALLDQPGTAAASKMPSAKHQQMLTLLVQRPDDGFRILRDDYPTLERQRVTPLLRQMGSGDESAQAKARQTLLTLLDHHSNQA